MRQQIKRGIAVMAVTGAVSAASSGNISVPSPILRRGRAFSESLLGIRFNMPRWQIAQTIALALVSVTLVAGATMHYHLPLMQKIADFHNKMPGSFPMCQLPVAHASACTAVFEGGGTL